MFPEFTFDPQNPSDASAQPRLISPDEKARLEEALRRVLKPGEQNRLELLLLQRLKEHKPGLEQMLQDMSGHWTYEDHFYRFYHGSFKVFGVQTTTKTAVKLLRELLPERELNTAFEEIIKDGTGKSFDLSNNEQWERRTRPMLEAFAHAKFMIEMSVRYADLLSPPQPMPSGYAALLYLYDLR
jgi:hypothetical protein